MSQTTTEWDAAVGTGLVRLVAGALLLSRPRAVIGLGGGDPDDAVLRATFTYFGVRDLTLAAGALTATRPGRSARRQLMLQTLGDLTDAVLISALVSAGRLPRGRGTGFAALAAGTAVADYVVGRRLR